MKRLRFFLYNAVFFALSSRAQAATIQDNYGPFDVNFLTGQVVTGSLPGFNPALGTLDAVTLSYSSSAVLLTGNAISSQIRIQDSAGTLLKDITFPTMNGRAQQAENGSFSVPVSDLIDFESSGNIQLTLTPFTACRGSADTPTGCNGFTGIVEGQVTYTYTPVSTTPEPAAFGLCLLGFAGAGVARQVRRNRASLSLRSY